MDYEIDPARAEVSFSPSFVHRLHFTEDVPAWIKGCWPTCSSCPETGRPGSSSGLDEHVANAQPELRHRLTAFAAAHADRVTLAGNVQVVEGGEAVKNDIHILEPHAQGGQRRRAGPAELRGGDRRWGGSGRGRVRRGDRSPRLRLVRLPTTTLAQGDSGVGVKNAVNLFGEKNWLGSFAVPWAVINDTALLATLPDRDFVRGF